MNGDELLLHELHTDAPVRLAGAESVALTSAGLGWRGLSVEQQRLPAAETPDGYLPWHWLGVSLSGPRELEDRSDGRWRRHPLQRCDITLRPAGVPGRAAWREPVDTLNVAIDPAVVAEDTGGGTIEPRAAFGPDPVAIQDVEALAMEVAAQLIAPDANSLQAIGPNIYDPERRAAAATAGRQQGVHAASSVAAGWS